MTFLRSAASCGPRPVRLLEAGGPGVLLGHTVALAYGPGLWLVLLHAVEGGHEHGEPPLLLHALRDATLALPAVAVAVFLALVVAARLLAGPGAGVSPLLARLVVAATAALGASAALAAGSPVHALLFEAHEGHELPPLVHAGRDFLLALSAALPIALVLAGLGALPRRCAPRAALAFGAAALAATGLGGSDVRAAEVGPGSLCPTGAPLKTFDVHAIDVDITLNRFGDHDPTGKMYVLSSRVADVRAQETAALANRVSTGLRDDAIQPLVIRANQGDCVEITFTNNASGGAYGIHIDGLAFEVGSAGEAVGSTPDTTVARGGTRLYRYFVPDAPELEGAHVMRPGPGMREALAHGLFGVLVVEPPGSKYLHPRTAEPLASGWEAMVVPGTTRPAFREYVTIYHEIGNEDFRIKTKDGGELPQVDPITESYRPGSRALNYRSEPFLNRLQANPREEALGYGSYTFGDPATPMPRAYQADPTKVRLVHAGSEMFHVHHLHGGGIRWRFNPLADHTYDYADSGLRKHPVTQASPSTRLDSQAIGPTEAYNLEIEGGAGGVQQAAGDFLYHCHIAEHYVSGMWSFWRVFDTLQPDLAPLPDRAALPAPVDSAGLIGRTMPNRITLTASNLDDWIGPQLPPQGVPSNGEDASVWNWTVDRSDPKAPVYLGEPEDTRPWPNLPNLDPAHPGSLAVDVTPGFGGFVGDRPKILFNPRNGRPAWPLLRPHIGRRPPFSPRGHSGAPWLGERGNAPASGSVDPWSGRPDGICPAGSPLRRFNVVAIELPIQVTRNRGIDGEGKIYVLARDKADVLAGRKPAEPLAIRSNIGDCDHVVLTSEQTDVSATTGFAKVNMHIHHVQFDVQASDGVITGMSFEQSVRPYKVEDPRLTKRAAAGATTLSLSSVAKFRPGVWIGVGLGTEGVEIHQIASVDATAGTVRLKTPFASTHDAGEWAGVEFVQYLWYPDVQLDNIFWHDHVDGIHNWGHGLVGQLIVEPPGSTYHDPVTGEELASGTIVDIRTTNSLVAGVVDGSFRELALWTIDENPVAGSTLNLRAEPFADRLTANSDPSLLFSSYTHGDPFTPLPRAYAGDPVVIRTINVGPSVDSLHVDGLRFLLEPRYVEAGEQVATPEDTLHYGISERDTLILQTGEESRMRVPGDYLYMNAVGRRFRDGAWGIVRVLGSQVPDLQSLPGNTPPSGGSLPAPTGGRPPEPAGPGNPCPANAPVRSFEISAVDVPTNNSGPGNNNAVRAVFVPSSDAALARKGTLQPEPLVLHAAEGECVVVRLTNERQARVSFHVGEVVRTPESSGINVGFNPEQTVAPGQSRTYRLYADSEKIESALISDFGDPESGQIGLYGALIVAPAGATFTDPGNGKAKDVGAQVDVHVPGRPSYRDFTAILTDRDPRIGQSSMPYPTQVEGPALVNYRTVGPRADDGGAFSSDKNGDPATPIVRAQAGDPLRVHALVAPTSEQTHVFSLGGLSWPIDPRIPQAEELESRAVGPWQAVDAAVVGGAGGRARFVGDLFFGDLRRPFTMAGMWGLQRVLPRGAGKGLEWGPVLDSTRPMVEITGPATGSLLSGTAPLSASGFDNVGVTEVLFRLDGLPLGTDTTAPFSVPWDSTSVADGAHTLSAVARDAAGNATGSMPVAITVDNTAPTAVLEDPGEFLRSTVPLTASATDANGVASVAFQWAAAGTSAWTTIATDETAPFSASLATTALVDGLYDLRAVATDRAGNKGVSAVLAGRQVDNTAPVVSVTEPLAGVTVTRIVKVAASPLDNVGVVGVQFRLDGAALGAEDTSSPHESTWDTTLTADGLHVLTAVARDAAGNTTLSAEVSVTVANLLGG